MLSIELVMFHQDIVVEKEQFAEIEVLKFQIHHYHSISFVITPVVDVSNIKDIVHLS